MLGTTVVIAALIVFGIVAAALFLKSRDTQSPGNHEYARKPEFLSPAERSFFGVLQSAVGDNGIVLAKVRIADVIAPSKTADKAKWQRSFNRISAKHFDFLVCTADSVDPVVAVELDDKSHQSKSARARDQAKDDAAYSAGLPLMRIAADRAYSTNQVRAELREFGMSFGDHQSPPFNSDVVEATASNNSPPKCPKCQSDLVLRKGAKGKFAGKKFWGCSQFPNCRTLVPIEKLPGPQPTG